MRRFIGTGMVCAVVGLYAISPAWAQTSGEDSLYDTSYIMDTTSPQQDDEMAMAVDSEYRYIRSPLYFDDAQVQPKDTMYFRLGFDYLTESSYSVPATSREGARDDDFGLDLKWVWGCCDNVEVFAQLPINLGDGRYNGDSGDGNYDLSFGSTYMFWEEGTHFDWMPAFSLKGTVRIPTGYHSSGVDGELRGMWTKTIAGDLRGHFNAFATTVNGNNDPNARDFQWGFVFGADMPLNDARDLWLMMDYQHRSSEHYGNGNMNLVEAGVEWKMDDVQSVHFTTQVGLDGDGDTPNWGARIAYTYELRYQ